MKDNKDSPIPNCCYAGNFFLSTGLHTAPPGKPGGDRRSKEYSRRWAKIYSPNTDCWRSLAVLRCAVGFVSVLLPLLSWKVHSDLLRQSGSMFGILSCRVGINSLGLSWTPLIHQCNLWLAHLEVQSSHGRLGWSLPFVARTAAGWHRVKSMRFRSVTHGL